MNSQRLTFAAIGVAILILIGFSAMFQVHETRQAIVLQFGNPIRTVTQPGLQFKLPWQSVVTIDQRILNLDLPPQELITSDQKRVIVDAFARFEITDPLLVYQTVFDERGAANRLETVVNSVIRSVLGSAAFNTMLSEDRGRLMQSIRQSVNQEAQQFGINIVDVRIKRADLPEANSEAIFKRMRTEREREAREARAQGAELAQRIRSRADRERTVLIAEAQREAEIIRGEGDAQSVRIFAEAIGRDADFYNFYRSMQAYRESLKPEDTTMILSPDSEFFRFFDSLQGTTGRK